MPGTLGIHSFSARSAARDRLTVTAGAAVYDTVNVPEDSPSTTSIGGAGLSFEAPWFDDPNSGRFEPSTDELWFHARIYTATTSNNDSLVAGVATDGDEYLAISAQSSSNRITLRVAGVVRATATSAKLALFTWECLHVHAEGAAQGDTISVYQDGDLDTPVLTYELVTADATALAALGLPNAFTGTIKTDADDDRFDDFAAWDPAHANFPGETFIAFVGIKDQVFTGNGPEQEMTGDYTGIDERPASDADGLVADAPGQESSFTKPPVGEPNVLAVKFVARVLRDSTAAGENITLKTNDGTNTEVVTMPAPTDGDVQHIFERGPDALAWSPDEYDDTRFAALSAT